MYAIRSYYEIQKQVKMLRQSLKLQKDIKIIPFSSMTKQGRDEIWTTIESYLGPDPAKDPAMEQPNPTDPEASSV